MDKSNVNTPNPNSKTPFRTLGLRRSAVKQVKADVSESACLNDLNEVDDEYLQTPLQMRPIKGTCSVGDSDSDEMDRATVSTPAISVDKQSRLKRTRLSLSQSWKTKVISKPMRNFKRRKLLDEIESSSSSNSFTLPADHIDSTADDGAKNRTNISAMSQKIADLESNIKIWKKCCAQALKDLLEKSSYNTMESLQDVLGIPHNLIYYDDSEQTIDPD
ncbi:uncharacterized protein LOC128745399 [Sabethes cyaneus]|uniref:uncharacterized protein LOC128745399 n=1 Tax=Sabethes cyaneus TaxID=53552 RepID=UPI00237DBB02|nr:uncharacterized protein LOC128745399 [Sabethes cyaneus]